MNAKTRWVRKVCGILRGRPAGHFLTMSELVKLTGAGVDRASHFRAGIPHEFRLNTRIGRQPNMMVYGSPATVKLFTEQPDRKFFLDGQPFRKHVPAPERPAATAGAPAPSSRFEVDKDTAEAEVVGNHVRTLDDLLKYMKVDLKVWEVEKHTINKWEVGAKPGEGNTLKANRADTGFSVQALFQVKAWLARKKPTIIETAFERMLKELQSSKRPAPLLRLPKTENRYMLEVSLFDAHFGLLAWNRETGDDYDLKIAEASYAETMEDLLVKTQGCRPEKILLPFGNDFFHVNNPEGVTPMAHNILDVDGRLCKVVETGERALIRAIRRCLEITPVHILWIPGNHDPQTSYFLCRTLKAYFHDNPNVVVDVEPPARKYVHYGCNLIGFTHGNEEKHADLPTIMAGEQRDIWHQVSWCEWHIGHLHKKKETRYSAGDTYGGVSVKTLPSISGTDAWHFGKGYVKGKRMAEAFLWDYARGLAATYSSENLRTKR